MKHKKPADEKKVAKRKKSDEKQDGKRKKGSKKEKVEVVQLTKEEIAALELAKKQKIEEERERKVNEPYYKYIALLKEQNMRAALLSDPIKTIISMRRAHKIWKRDQLEVKKWNEYLSCSTLPNVKDSPGVRAFIYMWKNEIQQDLKNYISWVLRVDEHSILTQDRSKENTCFWKLYNQQPVIGEHYLPRFEQCHTLLNEIEHELRETHEPELLAIKKDLRSQLVIVLDSFTIRILSNVERDMTRIDPCIANHNFKSIYFSLSLWSTRPVPQPSKNWMKENKLVVIEFSEINAKIILPKQIETDGFSFRGLMLQYDHLSDTAQSAQLSYTFPVTPDLRTSNENEWKKREEIMHTKLNEMREERLKWEKKEADKILKEEAEKKGKPRKPSIDLEAKTKTKIKLGPPIVTESTVLDVTEDYLKYEKDLFIQQRSALRAESLHLAEGEINLREFRMFGGIYALHYLKRPQQYTQLKYQFLYKIDTSQILERAEFVATGDTDLVELHLKLSGNVCWWVTPIACYWQPWEESDEFLALSPELQDFHKNYDKYVKKLENLLFTEAKPKKNFNLVKCLNDFSLDVLPTGIDLRKLMEDYIVPRMPITFKFKVELDEENEVARREALRLKEREMEKSEINQKRRALFDAEMKENLAKVRADVHDALAEMRDEFKQFFVVERERLVNRGENELMIDRFLKHKNEVDQEKMRDFESDAMAKYHDYVEQQFKERILEVEANDEAIIAPTQCIIKKLEPIDLFLTKPRQLPLELVDENAVNNFDVPNADDPPGYDGELSDNMLLSTFLRYLIFLFEKNKPHFTEKPKDEVEEPVPITTIPVTPVASDTKHKNAPGKRPTSRKKGSKKSKTSKISGEKLAAPSDGSKKPKTPKKPKLSKPGKERGGASTSETSPRSATSRSKKSSKSVSSKKGSKSPKKNSKKSLTKKQKYDLVEPEIQSQAEMVQKASILSAHIKRKQKGNILQLVPHFPGKWVQSGITLTDFNAELKEAKCQISRFGTFGFAMPLYCNFPYKYWEIYPNIHKKHSVLLKVIGNYVEVKIEITDEGYLIEQIEPNTINFIWKQNAAALKYHDFKDMLLNSGINIFPDRDAEIYIDGITEKHRAMEEHSYYCLAEFTLSHYFRQSDFNRLSNYRIAIVEFYEVRDNVSTPDEFTQIMITPESCNFVVVSSKTNENYLDYKMVPIEQDFYPDLYNLLKANCNEQSMKYHEQMRDLHRFNVARLLCAIGPLSFA